MAAVKKQAQPEAVQPEHTEELKRKIQVLRDDFLIFSAKNLKIKTKEGEIKPLELNSAQLYIHGQLEKQLKETGKIRCLILKGRQMGVSTLIQARCYWRVSMNMGKNAYILCHDASGTSNLFSMTKRMHDLSHPALKPSISASNVKELIFNKLDSGYKCSTAGGSGGGGRGHTIQYMHGSEIGFWERAPEVMSGVMQAVPNAPSTEIYLESTANGCGNFFHTMWMQAIRGEGSYIPIFCPWFWMDTYRENAVGFVPTEAELRMKNDYNLDDEQLAFYRSKVFELGAQLASQEYPATWSEAFISSGRNLIDKDDLTAALKECWAPKKTMVLENKRWVERAGGELKIWEDAKEGHRYVLGADVAEGTISGDFSSADVLDMDGTQVAQWHGHIAPDLFGEVLAALGHKYKNALVCCEANNHGLTTNTYLRDVARYPNIYVQTAIDDRGSDEKQTRRLGFLTTRRSKPLILDNLCALFRERDTGVACKETIIECQTYIVLEDGTCSAASSCYDDRVMSYAIAAWVVKSCPAYKKRNRQ